MSGLKIEWEETGVGRRGRCERYGCRFNEILKIVDRIGRRLLGFRWRYR
jgi:hypothetical protein